MEHFTRKRLIVLLMILTVILLLHKCSESLTTSYSYTSPEGSNTIIVKYDLASRPTIYKKGLFYQQKIWDYPGHGFNETVVFNVEWLSEDEIRFFYLGYHDPDDDYVVSIPK